MGEIADAMISGEMCSQCGEYLGGGDGYPRTCRGCSGAAKAPKPQAKRHQRMPHGPPVELAAFLLWVESTFGLVSVPTKAPHEVFRLRPRTGPPIIAWRRDSPLSHWTADERGKSLLRTFDALESLRKMWPRDAEPSR